MRALAWIATLALLTGAAAAGPKVTKPAKPVETTWFVVCFDQDAQFTQVLGGVGFFHSGNGDHTYQTQKMVQSFFDGNTLCAVSDPKAPKATSGVAEVCVNRAAHVVSLMYDSDAASKRVTPKNADPFCQAHFDVIQQ